MRKLIILRVLVLAVAIGWPVSSLKLPHVKRAYSEKENRQIASEVAEIKLSRKLRTKIRELATIEAYHQKQLGESEFATSEKYVAYLKKVAQTSPDRSNRWLAISRLARLLHKNFYHPSYHAIIEKLVQKQFISCSGHFECLKMIERLFEMADIFPQMIARQASIIDRSSLTGVPHKIVDYAMKSLTAYLDFASYSGITDYTSRKKINKTLGYPTQKLKSLQYDLAILERKHAELSNDLERLYDRKSSFKKAFRYNDRDFPAEDPSSFAEVLFENIKLKIDYLQRGNRSLALYLERYQQRNPLMWFQELERRHDLSVNNKRHLSAEEIFWTLFRFRRLELELAYRNEYLDMAEEFAEKSARENPDMEEEIEHAFAMTKNAYKSVTGIYNLFFQEEFGHLTKAESKAAYKTLGNKQEKILFDAKGEFISFIDEIIKKNKLYAALKESSDYYKKFKKKNHKKRMKSELKRYDRLVEKNTLRWATLQCKLISATYPTLPFYSRTSSWWGSSPRWYRDPLRPKQNYALREACHFYAPHIDQIKKNPARQSIDAKVKSYIKRTNKTRKAISSVIHSTEFEIFLEFAAFFPAVRMTTVTVAAFKKAAAHAARKSLSKMAVRNFNKVATKFPRMASFARKGLAHTAESLVASTLFALTTGTFVAMTGNNTIFQNWAEFHAGEIAVYFAYPLYMRRASAIVHRVAPRVKNLRVAQKIQSRNISQKAYNFFSRPVPKGVLAVNKDVISYLPMAPVYVIISSLLNKEEELIPTEQVKQVTGEENYINYIIVTLTRLTMSLKF